MVKKKSSIDDPDEALLISLFNDVLERDPTTLEKSRWLIAMARPDYLTTEASIRAVLMTKAEYKPKTETVELPVETKDKAKETDSK